MSVRRDTGRYGRVLAGVLMGAVLGAALTAQTQQQGSAQQPSPVQQVSAAAGSAQLAGDLQRMGAAADALMTALPSFTCDETAVSQAVRDGKVLRSMNLSGVVRAVRQKNGQLVETNQIKSQHMLLVLPKVPPVFVSGGFAEVLGYFQPGAQACYRYTLPADTPGRIDFAARTEFAGGAASGAALLCKDRGLKGYALLDAKGNVSHVERSIPPDVAKSLKLASYASIDLAPVALNGHTYQLSSHMIAEMPLEGKAMGHFEATYTNCHQFAATVTLGAAAEVPAGEAGQP